MKWDWHIWTGYIQDIKPFKKACDTKAKRLPPLKGQADHDQPPSLRETSLSKIDLHGLTLQQAFYTFCQSVEAAFSHKRKTLLVITGVGGSLRDGAIRRELPFWTEHPRVRPLILSWSQAPSSQGGAGAFIVTLTAVRKKS